ncbi:MAG: response regulator transcription factor [Clostridia bacterium]|nr:response regulator transcription factor [Clostridia bacterium]
MGSEKLNATVLVVDDDPEIVSAITKLLEMEGYSVLKAYDGLEALEVLSQNKVHLILMDLMMPRVDGLSAVMRIRKDNNIPIIILSARTEDNDKILGLNVGADDYIAKPYNPMELLARVGSQLRRYFRLGASDGGDDGNSLRVGGLRMDLATKTFYVDERPVKLTSTEYRIMEVFMRAPGTVYSAEEIYKAAWKEEPHAAENTVTVHIRRIREKIEIDPRDPRYLKVVWGIGYKLEK